jgi:hypothetical protein
MLVVLSVCLMGLIPFMSVLCLLFRILFSCNISWRSSFPLFRRRIDHKDGGYTTVQTTTGGIGSIVRVCASIVIVSYLVLLFLGSRYTVVSTLEFELPPDPNAVAVAADPRQDSLLAQEVSSSSAAASSSSSSSSSSSAPPTSMALSWQVTLIGMDEATAACASTCAALTASTLSTGNAPAASASSTSSSGGSASSSSTATAADALGYVAIGGRFTCAPVPELAGCRATFSGRMVRCVNHITTGSSIFAKWVSLPHVPVFHGISTFLLFAPDCLSAIRPSSSSVRPQYAAWVMPERVRISFAFNATRAHAIEWRAENAYSANEMAQSLSGTLEADRGAVLFGHASNTVTLNYQYTRVASLNAPQPISYGYSAFFASRSALSQVDASNYYLENASAPASAQAALAPLGSVPGVRFEFTLMRSDQIRMLTVVAGNELIVFNSILSFFAVAALALTLLVRHADATRIRLQRKECHKNLNCCEARVLGFLRAWSAMSSVFRSNEFDAVVIAGDSDEDEDGTTTSAKSGGKQVVLAMPGVLGAQPHLVSPLPSSLPSMSATMSGNQHRGLIAGAGIEMTDMTSIDAGPTSAVSSDTGSAASPGSGAESGPELSISSTAPRSNDNAHLAFRPSWLRAAEKSRSEQNE